MKTTYQNMFYYFLLTCKYHRTPHRNAFSFGNMATYFQILVKELAHPLFGTTSTIIAFEHSTELPKPPIMRPSKVKSFYYIFYYTKEKEIDLN